MEELRRRSPDTPVLAVDLPGRGRTEGTLMGARIADWGASIVAQIEAAGLDEVVLVGHSLAGLSVPDAATRLGTRRVRRIMFMGAAVPPQGQSLVESAAPLMRWWVRAVSARGVPIPAMPGALAALWFCNGMTPEQKRYSVARLCPESPTVMAERVDRSALPRAIPRTWIITLRDRALSPRVQRQGIENLGVDETVEIDACHNAMISAPGRLAEILLARVPAGGGVPPAAQA